MIRLPRLSSTKQTARQFLREVNPMVWPVGAAVLTGNVLRRAVRMPKTAHLHSRVSVSSPDALDAIMKWLVRAQKSTGTGGVAAYYSLYGGFGPPYPETTGYIIPTFLEYARRSGDDAYVEHARDAVRWLGTLQRGDGSFPGGFGRPSDDASVFNTGQILFGLVATSSLPGLDSLERAIRAGRWLVSVQSPDGVWRSHTYEGRPHVYYTMVAWALSELYAVTGEAEFRDAARRNLEAAIRAQTPNGFFEGFNLGHRPIFLHFIAYTLQGLVEAGRLTDYPQAIDAAFRTAEILLRRFEIRKRLPGAFKPDWTPDGDYDCATGDAQMAHVWIRLAAERNDLRFLNAALKINELAKSRVSRSGTPGIRGAVPGSDPIWGAYLYLRYPNWAAKFTADALMLEEDALAALEAAEVACASSS